MTHPIQYYSPWFRYLATDVPEIELSVVYVSEPSPRQQGAHFETEFVWDIPLRDGYDSVVVRPARPGDAFGTSRFWGLDVSELGSAIEASRPDTVLVSGWHSVSLVRAIFWCRRRGIPLLYRGDTHLADRAGSLSWRLRTRFLLTRFDRYLSVGVRAREYLKRFGIDDESVHDSPHAVDNAFFEEQARPFQEGDARDAARRDIDIAAAAFVVLFVGKLEAKKRPRDLIRALPLMSPSPVLVVVGSGALETACREDAAELGVDVRFCGFLNQSELGRVYGISDCLVLPSDWGETWGLVVNEAMASGVPCVVSDRGGCAPDLVVAGRTGETFAFGDRNELAHAIERVRRGPSRAEACREHMRGYDFRAATHGLLAACREAVTP